MSPSDNKIGGLFSLGFVLVLSRQSMVSRSPSAFSAFVDGDIIFFDPEQGRYFGSGPVGARIWALLEEKETVDGICAVLLEEFDVGLDRCEREVTAFLRELEGRGLIHVS